MLRPPYRPTMLDGRISRLALAACAGLCMGMAAAATEARMQVESASIADGRIARIHACRGQGGRDQPLQLSVEDIPPAAHFLAIVADDPDALQPAGEVWVHWNVFNLRSSGPLLEIAAGQALDGIIGTTSGGVRGYEGMCPPDGVHRYRFAIFALRDRIAIDAKKPWTIEQFQEKFGAQVLEKAVVYGRF
jgi:Raf kinase inhibitor-like YbhB/YbcL family protein